MNYRLYKDTEKATEEITRVNEDRYMFSEFSFMGDKKIRLVIIADGMGGLSDGAKAAEDAIWGFAGSFYPRIMNRYAESDMKNYSLKYAVSDIEDAVIEAMKEANRNVCRNTMPYAHAGTTLSVVCIVDDCAVMANVGDSPIYYYNKKGRKLSLISQLQTKAEQDAMAGAYEKFSDEYYMNDNILYSYMGQYSELEADDIYLASVGNLTDGDIILAGSDGCFGRIKNNVVKGLIEDVSREEEEFVLCQLFDLARLDGNDDQTAIMYIVEEE